MVQLCTLLANMDLQYREKKNLEKDNGDIAGMVEIANAEQILYKRQQVLLH
jgi:hypothetical protein